MTNKGFVGIIATFVLVVLLAIGFFMFVERVPEGKVSVVYTPSGGAEEVLSAGWHVVGLFEKTQQYPTRITIIEDKVSTTTSDGKKITMPVRYEMKVDSTKVLNIFKELGSQNIDQLQEGYLYQKLFQASRSVISDYSVLDIYGEKATEASAKVTEQMASNTRDMGFLITDVTLGSPELDEATQKSIDERVRASQELEKKKIDEQLAQAEARRLKIEAEGQAQAEIEKARGIAESNRIISESITPELIEMRLAEARLKHGYVTVQGGTPIVDAK